ncbi:hypothetical protein ACLKA6_008311 [Drosophila palustris]
MRTCSCDKFAFSGWQTGQDAAGQSLALIDTETEATVEGGNNVWHGGKVARWVWQVQQPAMKRSGTPVSNKEVPTKKKKEMRDADSDEHDVDDDDEEENDDPRWPHFVPF